MNTPWWFRLYTLHTLKFLAKLTACQFALHYVLYQAGGSFVSFSGLVVLLGPFAYMTSHTSSHFRNNIEFHKMSMSFPVLKKAFFMDIFIKQTALGALFLINLFIAIEMNGGMKLAGDIMFITPSQLLYFIPIYYLGSASTMTHSRQSKYEFCRKHRLPIVNLAVFALTMTVFGTAFITLVSYGYDFHGLIGFCFASLATAILLFRSKAIFHQYRAVGRFRDAFKFSGYGLAICACFYFFAAFVGRNDVLDTHFSSSQRASSFVFSGPFAPEIDKETFVAIERHVQDEAVAQLYHKADFPVGSLGVDYFLDNDPNSTRLKAMLTYSKADPKFLTALYDHFEAHPGYWKEKYGPLTFKEFAYSRWPSKVLPEHYALAKANTLKEIEEKKLEWRRNREIASKKRSR